MRFLASIFMAVGVLIGAVIPSWPQEGQAPAKSPVEIIKASFLAYYAGQYEALYELISLKDREFKTKGEYLSEHPPFEPAEQTVAKLLATAIRFEKSEVKLQGNRARVTITARVPDDSKNPFASILEEPEKRIEELKKVLKSGELPLREEKFSQVLVREGSAWRLSLDWASAVKVHFSGEVKNDLPWEFGPKRSFIRIKRGENLQVTYYARNRASEEVTGKASHIITPKKYAKYVEIVQCFCFIQQTLEPGERLEMPLVFRIRWDAPEDLKEIRVHYVFYPIRVFEEKMKLKHGRREGR